MVDVHAAYYVSRSNVLFSQLLSLGRTVQPQSSFTQSVAVDSSLGRDTRLVFTRYGSMNIKVTTSQGNNITISGYSQHSLVFVEIEGIVVSQI